MFVSLRSKLYDSYRNSFLFQWTFSVLISYLSVNIIFIFFYTAIDKKGLSISAFILKTVVIISIFILRRYCINLVKSTYQLFKKSSFFRKILFFCIFLPAIFKLNEYFLPLISTYFLISMDPVKFFIGFVFFSLIMFISLALIGIPFGDYGKSITDSHGSASWANENEIQNIFHEENTGVSINGVNRISEKDSFQNIGIVAPSGFGKTQTYVIPNIIFSGSHERSIVVTDPSGEIFKTTSGYMKSKGYEIKLLEPFSTKTDFYNPLQSVNTLSDAKIVSDTVLRQIESTGNPFWHTAASKLMSGLILLLRKTSDMKNKNYMSIGNVKRLLTLKKEELEKLVSGEELEDVRIELASFLKSNDDTRSGVEMTLDSALSLFSDANFSDITAQHSINFEELRIKKTIVYVVIPESKIKYSSPFLSIFYKQLFENLMLNDTGLPVYILLDEFGNMGCIPEFSNIITTSRKRNISISMILQDIDQIKSIYGDKNFSTIFNGGCVSKVYYPGLGLETCKYISETLGDRTILVKSETKENSKWFEGQETTSETKRRLLNPDEIRKLDKDKIIFVSSNASPIVLSTVQAYKNKIIQKKISELEEYVFLSQKETIKTEKVTL